jgi:pimeloyl-ACP methyl ester carboxylesterase
MWVEIAIISCAFLIGLSLLFSLPLTKRHSLKNQVNPQEIGLEVEEVTFLSTDGIKISGWWIPLVDSNRTIIFLHGYAGSMDPDLKYAPAFHDRGYNILMFDFRAHGRSGGNATSLGALETRDVLGAIEFVRSRVDCKIGLMGFSMGGRAALMTGVVNKEISAIISDGGPVHLLTAISENLKVKKLPFFLAIVIAWMILLGASMRLLTNLFINDPISQKQKLSPIPILIIHGDKDPYTHLDELEKTASNSGETAQLWRVAEAGHRDADQYRPKEYLEKVFGFFDKWMN